MVLKDEVRGAQPTAGLEQPAQERGRHTKGRVGDNVEGSARQPEIAGVGLDDRHLAAVGVAKEGDAIRVGFDGDHLSAGVDKWAGQRAAAGADVENDVAGTYRRLIDQALGPPRIELMPSPPLSAPPLSGVWP